VSEWVGLKSFPAATQASLGALLAEMQGRGQSSLTVLLLGKGGAGKSSTCNSLLGERAAPVVAFANPEAPRPLVVGRSAAGFTLTLIDTPGLVEADSVSSRALASIAATLAARPVHACLYVDRLDCWRVDSLDREVFAALSRTLGPSLWSRTALALTHGQLTPPEGLAYGPYVERRAKSLRDALWSTLGAGSSGGPELPLVLVENSGRCATSEQGEKVLPNGVAWLPACFRQLAALSATGGGAPFVFDPEAVRSQTEHKGGLRSLLTMLPLLAAQVLASRLLVRQMRRDGEPRSLAMQFD